MSFFLLVGMTVQAQSAKKGCCSKSAKASCSKDKAKASASVDTEIKEITEISEAEIAAQENENIQVKKCAVSGNVSFFERSEDESGEVSWAQVEYDEEDKAFTRVASASVEKEVVVEVEKEGKKSKKACCSKGDKAGCAKGKVKSASSEKEVVEMNGEKKACCSKKGAKKSCSKTK